MASSNLVFGCKEFYKISIYIIKIGVNLAASPNTG